MCAMCKMRDGIVLTNDGRMLCVTCWQLRWALQRALAMLAEGR